MGASGCTWLKHEQGGWSNSLGLFGSYCIQAALQPYPQDQISCMFTLSHHTLATLCACSL